jgi:hypothetical protein
MPDQHLIVSSGGVCATQPSLAVSALRQRKVVFLDDG